MANKKSVIFSTPKSNDITFKTLAVGDFTKRAEFSPDIFVSVEKTINGKKEPITKVADEKGNALEWGLKCPFLASCTPDKSIGDVELSQSLCVCEKKCDRVEVSIEAQHGKVKEIITLHEKPDSNEFELLSFGTNLDYELSNPIEDIHCPGLQPADPVPILGYHGVRWKKGSDVIFFWDILKVEDSAGSVTFGMYQQPESGKNIKFTIGQEWLDSAVYPVFIDPTTYPVVDTGPSPTNTTLGGRASTQTSGLYHLAFQEGSTGIVRYFTAADPTGDWDDETAGVLIPDNAGALLALGAFSNGDVMVCAFGNSTSTSYYSQLRQQNGAWGTLTTLDSQIGFTGSVYHNISIVVDELDNIFWLIMPRSDFPLTVIVLRLQLLKSSQSDPTNWTVKSVPMSNIDGFWNGSCWGMVADGNDHLHIFSRESLGFGDASNIFTQRYTISTNSYDNNGTSIGTTTSEGTAVSMMGITVLIDSNGVLSIAYTIDNDDGSGGDFVYAEKYSGSWVSHALTDFNVGSGMVDSNNHVILGERNITNVGLGTEQIKRFFEGALQETSEWFPGYWLFWQPHHGGVEALYQGEPYWAIGYNNAVDLRFMQNTTYDYPSTADTDPPTGVAITSPTAAQENISIMPSIVCSAGADDTPPISYYFQVDTVNTFDSANLQESGWQSADITWTPPTILPALTEHFTRVRARDAVEPPNVGSYAAIISFTTGGWVYPGETQPTIVYDGNTIYFPIPIRCRPTKFSGNKINQGFDKSVEVVGNSRPSEVLVTMTPVMAAAFDAEMKTFYDDWAGKQKWFTFTSGVNSRYDGGWLLKPKEWRPKIMEAYKTYTFTLYRPNDG